VFSSTSKRSSGFQEVKAKWLNKNSSLAGVLGNLLKYLKEMIFKPCRIDGMRIYQDFDE